MLWNVKTGEPILPNPLKGHSNWVNSVAFSPDGSTLASGSGDTTINIVHRPVGKDCASTWNHVKCCCIVADIVQLFPIPSSPCVRVTLT